MVAIPAGLIAERRVIMRLMRADAVILMSIAMYLTVPAVRS